MIFMGLLWAILSSFSLDLGDICLPRWIQGEELSSFFWRVGEWSIWEVFWWIPW